MSLAHSLFHTTALVRNDWRRDVRSLWPRGTTIADHDVIVGGRSLVGLARERHTPCLLIAPAEPTADHISADEHLTLVIATVTDRGEPRRWHREATVTVDCDLRAIADRVIHVDLLTAPHSRDLAAATLVSADGTALLHVRLPQVVSPGDLIVFACAGALALSQVAPRPRAAETEHEEDAGRRACRKE